MNSTIEIEINGSPLTLKKIPLRKYAEIIPALKDLTQYSSLFSDLSTDAIMEALPTVLTTAPESVENLLAIAQDFDREQMKEWGIDDYVHVIEGILSVNDFAYVYLTLKKGLAQLNIKQPGMEVLKSLQKDPATDGQETQSQN